LITGRTVVFDSVVPRSCARDLLVISMPEHCCCAPSTAHARRTLPTVVVLLTQQMPPPGYNYQQYPPQQHPDMAASQYQNQTGYTPQVCAPAIDL
jgi:hypothetical protein